MEDSNIFLQLQHLSYSYDRKAILADLNLSVKEQEFVCIIGRSGCGKSTLLKLLAQVTSGYQGQIVFQGRDLKSNHKALPYMPQGELLLPWKTTVENIILPLLLKGSKKQEALTFIKPLMETFGLKGLEKKYPSCLSGGQKQRACLLRAVCTKGNMLLLDEPFSKVDAITRAELHTFLHSLHRRHCYTTLLVTHDLQEAIALADSIYVLKDGKLSSKLQVNLTDKERFSTFHDAATTAKTDAYKAFLLSCL